MDDALAEERVGWWRGRARDARARAAHPCQSRGPSV